MPNTDPPIDSSPVVECILRLAQTEGVVRVLPIGCITKDRQGEALSEMGELAQTGVVAFSDDGSPVGDAHLMRHALEYSLLFDLPLIQHCESLALSDGGAMNEGAVSTRLGLRGIPAAAEETIVSRDIALAEFTGAHLHIAHTSTAGSVEFIRRAKERGARVTAEVTPHHLTLTEERVLHPIPYDTNAKVNPPLRTERDIEALLQGLREGVIDAIATDHSPHTLEDKLCEFGLAAFGISGLETALGSLLSLVHRGKIELVMLISKLTAEPARILKRDDIGTLKVGACGDVVLFDLNREWLVKPEEFISKGKNTPLAGEVLTGKMMATVFSGEIVYRDEKVQVS
jgi:dihydroorotase